VTSIFSLEPAVQWATQRLEVGERFVVLGINNCSAGHRALESMSPSDATRYLCAAVQLNSKLAGQVVRDILDDYKAPPWSPDVGFVWPGAVSNRRPSAFSSTLLPIRVAATLPTQGLPSYCGCHGRPVLLALSLDSGGR
jgi:hypothetical protein